MAVKIFNEIWMEIGQRDKSRIIAIMQAERLIDMAYFKRSYGIIPSYYTKEYWIEVRKYLCNLSST